MAHQVMEKTALSPELLERASQEAGRRLRVLKSLIVHPELTSAEVGRLGTKASHNAWREKVFQTRARLKRMGVKSSTMPDYARVRPIEKQAAEGDMGAILSGAIANRFGARPALNDLAQTENNQREPAVTDAQEQSLPQLPAGRGIDSNQQPGQLLEAGTSIDETRRQHGLSKHAMEKDAWNPMANFIRPIAHDVGRAAGVVNRGFVQPIARDVAAAGRRVGKVFKGKPGPQLATAEQAATFRPLPPVAAAAQAAPGRVAAAPGHVVPPGGAPAAPGAVGGPPAASGKLSRKGQKMTEIEDVQGAKPRKGPSLLGGLATGGILAGSAYGLAKGLPAAANALGAATSQPMAYGMGYSNLPMYGEATPY